MSTENITIGERTYKTEKDTLRVIAEIVLPPKIFVVGRDGAELPYYGCKVSIPPDALEQDTEICLDIRNASLPDMVVSPILRCEPTNLEFKCPVMITLPLNVSPVVSVPRSQWPELTLMCCRNGKWSKVESRKFSYEGMSFECTHFSLYCWTIDAFGQEKCTKNLACFLCKGEFGIEGLDALVAICDNVPDVVERVKVGLAQQGFLVVEEVQSLNVPEGKDVTIKHTILSKEENASVEVTPSQVQVLTATAIWPRVCVKKRRFQVICKKEACTRCREHHHPQLRIQFEVESEGADKTEMTFLLEGCNKKPQDGFENGKSNGCLPEGDLSIDNTRHVLVLSRHWGWAEGDVVSRNMKEVAINLTKNGGTAENNNQSVRVSCLVTKTSVELKEEAELSGVSLFGVKPLPGHSLMERLSCLPEDIGQIDVVLGCGIETGKRACSIQEQTRCKRVHVVGICHEDYGMCEGITASEDRHTDETDLCRKADMVVAMGSRLRYKYERCLEVANDIHDFTPGIFGEFSDVKQAEKDGEEFRLLMFYPSSSEIKEEDLSAKIAKMLPEGKFRVFLVDVPGDSKVKETAHHEQLRSRLVIRGPYQSIKRRRELFCEMDLLVLFCRLSHLEDFGFVTLQAVSARLPVLVSKYLGIADAFKKLPNGDSHVVDSDGAEQWKKRIISVKKKERDLRLKEAAILRDNYSQEFPWKKQGRDLSEKILELC